MIRIILICTFALILVFSLCCHDTYALKKSVHITKLADKRKQQLKISWKERDNKILHDSVCFNYPEGDIVYRDCRDEARVLFRQRCEKFTDLYKSTKAPYDQQHKKDMDKYCRSASIYWP